MSLLGDLLAQTHIWATWSLLGGIVVLLLLIMLRSRFEKMVWIMLIVMALYSIVMGVLLWLRLYGVDTTIAGALASLFFSFAVLATSTALLVSKSRSSRHS